MMQLDLGTKVAITITGQREKAITNEVFLADAVIEALPKLDSRVLVIMRDAINRETLSRSDIITKQTEI